MQFEAREVGHPDERRRVARHDFLGAPAGRELQSDDFHPVGPRRRRALLVEELAVNAVGITHQDVRTSARALERAVRDRDEVTSRGPAWCSRRQETAPCADSRSRFRVRRRSGARVRLDRPSAGPIIAYDARDVAPTPLAPLTQHRTGIIISYKLISHIGK